MKDCVFTGINDKYWKPWGASWIYSLRNVAAYKGEVVVVDCGLSWGAREKLTEQGAKLIGCEERTGGVKIRTLSEIANYSKENRGRFVYWDSDVFFESSIDKVFEEISDKIVLAENKNPGFIAAPYYHWAFIGDVIGFVRLAKKSRSIENVLAEDFGRFIRYTSNVWNFTDLSVLDKAMIEAKRPIVVHPTGMLKSTLSQKKFLFHERGDEGYAKFIEPHGKMNLARKLINKS